jgi:hypothetical protein
LLPRAFVIQVQERLAFGDSLEFQGYLSSGAKHIARGSDLGLTHLFEQRRILGRGRPIEAGGDIAIRRNDQVLTGF